jgi:hypothetical protein
MSLLLSAHGETLKILLVPPASGVGSVKSVSAREPSEFRVHAEMYPGKLASLERVLAYSVCPSEEMTISSPQ